MDDIDFDLSVGPSSFETDSSDTLTLRRTSVILVRDGDARPVPVPTTARLLARGPAGRDLMACGRLGPSRGRA